MRLLRTAKDAFLTTNKAIEDNESGRKEQIRNDWIDGINEIIRRGGFGTSFTVWPNDKEVLDNFVAELKDLGYNVETVDHYSDTSTGWFSNPKFELFYIDFRITWSSNETK